jgi:DNA-binding transcriptional ArsR family regulator
MELLKETHYIDDLETLRVVADPLRLRILTMLSDTPCNVKQVADRLGEKPTRLYYHVNALEGVGLVQLVETRINRSIVEKYYLAVARDIRVDSRLLKTKPDAVIYSMLNTVLDATLDDIELGLDHGTISVEDVDSETSSKVYLTRDAYRFRASQIPSLIDRLRGLMIEFSQAEVAQGEEIYGLTIAFYPSFTGKGEGENEQEGRDL